MSEIVTTITLGTVPMVLKTKFNKLTTNTSDVNINETTDYKLIQITNNENFK